MTTLISYATPDYSRAAKLLSRTAKRCGVDKTIVFHREDLEATDFYREHKSILDEKRGGGFWLWKPFFIVETLRSMQHGEYLIYADSGILFRKNVAPLLRLVDEKNDIAFFYNATPAGTYTKRDVFVALGCDSPGFYTAPMVHAGFQVYYKTDSSLKFAEEWLNYCTVDRLITDDPSKKENLPGFKENRHDQSILALLVHRHKRKIFADPSQFIVKPADYVFGQGDILHKELPYERIIYVHRYKNRDIWKLGADVIKKILSIK